MELALQVLPRSTPLPKVLALILMESKVVLQSRDLNSLSLSVMALTHLIYPLQVSENQPADTSTPHLNSPSPTFPSMCSL